MNEFLLVSVIASAWCLGIWAITEQGKLFAFLRQPILKYIDNKTKYYLNKQEEITKDYSNLQLNCDDLQRNIYRDRMVVELTSVKKEFNGFKFVMKFLNPIILCPTCMGSVHGFVIFSMHYPISFYVIPVMVITSGLNKIWHEKIF